MNRWILNPLPALRLSKIILLVVIGTTTLTAIHAQTEQQVADKFRISRELVRRINKETAISNEALFRHSDEILPRLLRKLEYPDLIRQRNAFRLLQEQDERGVVPRDAVIRALEQLDSLRVRTTKLNVAGLPVTSAQPLTPLMRLMPPPPVGGLQANRWVYLGPGNIGGRIRSIIVHPTNPNVIWVGSVGGGIWRSDDAGNSFAPVDDRMANLAVSCMVMDPTNPQILYAGTGEGYFDREDARRGAGIFSTTDGVNWTRLTATNNENFHFTTQLAISRNGQVLLASTPEGIFRSTDRDRLLWNRATLIDGTVQEPLAAAIGDVDFHPSDNTKVIAGGMNGQAFYSTDGGSTWKKATHAGFWSGRIEVTYAKANPSTVYASIDTNGGEVWRSVDGGTTYTRMNSALGSGGPANYLGDQGWYDNVVWAGDPTNANLVIVGGIDLWKSTDGGATFVDISSWYDSNSAHADHHVIVAHPGYNGTTNKTVYFGNDGGIYRTDDLYAVGNNPQPPRINGWIRLINTLGVTQFYGAAGNATTGTIIGGTQDNGSLVYTTAEGPDRWKEFFGGDGGKCEIDPTDPNVMYGEYVFLNIHRNTDGGATNDTRGDRYISGQYWNRDRRKWDWKPFPYSIPDAERSRALFIAPFILDPNNSNRILAGGMSLWRTNDAKTANTSTCNLTGPPCGPKWAAVKSSIGSEITAIAVARGNSDIVWVAHRNGEIYRTSNGTAQSPTWQRVDENGGGVLPNRYGTRITIDPTNANTVYLTFGGYSSGNVWKTIDAGANWSSIGSSLPEAPVRSLVIHPRNTRFLYIGSEVGVFASEDGGVTWSPTNEGPTSCSVDDLFWMGDTLVAATYGRGMFKINLPLQ